MWDDLRACGEVIRYDRSKPEQILERCVGATAVVTNKVPFSAKTLASLPELKFIGVTATGYDIIDCAAAKAQHVAVTNVPAYSTYMLPNIAWDCCWN